LFDGTFAGSIEGKIVIMPALKINVWDACSILGLASIAIVAGLAWLPLSFIAPWIGMFVLEVLGARNGIKPPHGGQPGKEPARVS
jgi:hypothetical protein